MEVSVRKLRHFSFFQFIHFFILRRQRGRHREKGIFLLLVHSPNVFQQLGIGQTKAKSHGLHPGLPQGWQGPRHSRPYFIPPGCTRDARSREEMELGAMYSNMARELLKRDVNLWGHDMDPSGFATLTLHGQSCFGESRKSRVCKGSF